MGNQDVTNFLLHANSDGILQPDGSEQMTYKPENLEFQALNVEQDNIVAFVKAYKNVMSWCQFLRKSSVPEVSNPIAEVVESIANDSKIAVTATSSHNGKLLKLLALERSEQVVKFSENGHTSIRERMANFTGNNNQQHGQQQQQ